MTLNKKQHQNSTLSVLFSGCFLVFLLHTIWEDGEKTKGVWRTYFTNMQNKFGRQMIRICSAVRRFSEAVLLFKLDRAVVYINDMVQGHGCVWFLKRKNCFFQLFSSAGWLSFRLLHPEIRPSLPLWHYPRLVRTAWKSITAKPHRISFSALKQIFNLRSSTQTKQACRNSPDARWQRAAASFLQS